MYCSKCGSGIAEGSKFCVKCGNPVELRRVSILRNAEEIEKHILILNDIIRMYEQVQLVCDEKQQVSICHKMFADLLMHLEFICRSNHMVNELNTYMTRLHMPDSTVTDAVEEIKNIIERVTAKIEESKRLISEIDAGIEELKTHDLADIRDMWRRANFLRLAYEIEAVYYEKQAEMQRLMLRADEERKCASCPPANAAPLQMPSFDKGHKKEVGVKGADNTPWYKRLWRKKSADKDEEPIVETFSLPDMALPDFDIKKEHNPPVISDVQFSAIVKRQAELSEYLSVDIIMYEGEFRKVVEERLDETVKETGSGHHNVEENSNIKIVLSSKDIEIDDGEEERIWQGKYLEFGFVVSIPGEYPKKQVQFCASVYINGLIATRLKFFVDINNPQKQNAELRREDITKAFVSYASKERDKVALIVQGMEKARQDLKVFFDVETLRSGDKWEDKLRSEIDGCGVFYLCWSRAASQSRWVDFEWRYALEKKGEECIEPIPIEPPETCPPPRELNQKHFNDKLVYMIKALEYMKEQFSEQPEGDTES